MFRLWRLTPVLVMLFYIIRVSWVLDQGMYSVQGERNKALYGYSFLNITHTTMERCLEKCLENCLCLSFQSCEDKKCQLCSSNKYLSPQAFMEKRGCDYFGFQRSISQDFNNQCDQGCFRGPICCSTSNPCQNGGTCEPPFPMDTTKRFRCACPPGFVGNLCEHPAKSCRAYINGTRIPGKYKIFERGMKLFEVFCDFDVNSTMAWTLIQSYQLQNNRNFQGYPFYKNHPVHGDSVVWDSYRLSKPRMESLRDDSSKWRITCRYDSDGINYTDYVRAAIDKFDILADDPTPKCKEVEYIDIRGKKCPSQGGPCTVMFYHSGSMLHIDSYDGPCRFGNSSRAEGIPCDNNRGEDNFGLFICINPAHRCSASPTSTTQAWFGGE